ncbi:replication initiation and membrane attachment family protein [Neobacillus mesonae]|uniref:replication initiation and membrane attachment family protein n=1 Tax=Neobacillus mesonae TaxID=1193713 RepID=UPI00203F8B5D|nr:replication initiation and membrane attachment family protein [Neobacillus mesonae]MCM3568324.1 replication initiation and membrane attachment family protein [Neobacillus mesonae]
MVQHWQEILPIDRYIVSANGLLHDYDRKILTFLYQPLIGSTCFSLYMTLWAELEENRLWGESSTHHLLMNLLGMNLKQIYEARLKLEGIGLLKTYVNVEDGERSFIYELFPPLTPEQFFLDGMLNIYLYRKIGKNHFARLKRFFTDQQIPTEKEFTEITKAFQDVFSSETPGSLHYLQDVSADLAPEENERFVGRHEAKEIQIDTQSFDFNLLAAGLNETLVPQKALTPKVKEVISNLAFLYGIDPIQMKNIVLSAVNESSEIDIEELRKGARDWYQFVNYDQLPNLVERTQPLIHQVQVSEPKTKEEKLIRYLETTSPLQFLKDVSGGAEPSKSDIQIIEDVMFKQKLLPGVINVLLHFVMLRNEMKLTKGYVEKIASHWARLQIKTVKDAMEMAKKEYRTYLSWAENKKSGGKGTKQKPTRTELLPDWFDEPQANQQKKQEKPASPDLEAKKREIEEMLKAFDD